MPIKLDPENNEIRALFALAQLDGRHVLEVGCGDGRLTWRYADRAGHVVAIDPFEEAIIQAKNALPQQLKARVEFHHAAFSNFAASCPASTFDIVILSWSLC